MSFICGRNGCIGHSSTATTKLHKLFDERMKLTGESVPENHRRTTQVCSSDAKRRQNPSTNPYSTTQPLTLNSHNRGGAATPQPRGEKRGGGEDKGREADTVTTQIHRITSSASTEDAYLFDSGAQTSFTGDSKDLKEIRPTRTKLVAFDGSMMQYSNVKGKMEVQLLTLEGQTVTIVVDAMAPDGRQDSRQKILAEVDVLNAIPEAVVVTTRGAKAILTTEGTIEIDPATSRIIQGRSGDPDIEPKLAAAIERAQEFGTKHLGVRTKRLQAVEVNEVVHATVDQAKEGEAAPADPNVAKGTSPVAFVPVYPGSDGWKILFPPKVEAERLEDEQKAKAEAVHLEVEEKAKAEAVRLEAEQKAEAEAERLEAEQKVTVTPKRQIATNSQAGTVSQRWRARKATALARAEAERLEDEKKAKEETARLEADRKAKAKAERLEAEQMAKAEADRLRTEQKVRARQEAEKEAAAERVAAEDARREREMAEASFRENAAKIKALLERIAQWSNKEDLKLAEIIPYNGECLALYRKASEYVPFQDIASRYTALKGDLKRKFRGLQERTKKREKARRIEAKRLRDERRALVRAEREREQENMRLAKAEEKILRRSAAALKNLERRIKDDGDTDEDAELTVIDLLKDADVVGHERQSNGSILFLLEKEERGSVPASFELARALTPLHLKSYMREKRLRAPHSDRKPPVIAIAIEELQTKLVDAARRIMESILMVPAMTCSLSCQKRAAICLVCNVEPLFECAAAIAGLLFARFSEITIACVFRSFKCFISHIQIHNS